MWQIRHVNYEHIYILEIECEIIFQTQLHTNKYVHQKDQKFLEGAKNTKGSPFSQVFS